MLLAVGAVVAICIHKMSSFDGMDYGLYKSRINGELVE